MKLRWVGPFACPTGFGRASHDYLSALVRAGADLDIVPIHDAEPDDLEPRYRHLLDYVLRDGFQPTHQVVHTIPRYAHEFVTSDLDPGPGVVKLALTTWETDRLPYEIGKLLDENFDLTIVPCAFNREAFADAGCAFVADVPHCYDPAWWAQPTAAPPDDRFVFTTVGVWCDRKHLLGLLKAYFSVFTAEDNVLLRIACPRVDTNALQSFVSRAGIRHPPAVEFVTKRMTEDELREFHGTGHCYVTASRGEAWGLGAFEAMILGKPVIAPSFGGSPEFLQRYEGYSPVPYHLTPAVADEMQLSDPVEIAGLRFVPVSTVAPTGIAADQYWAEPDLYTLAQAMHRYATHRVGEPAARWPGAPEYGPGRYRYATSLALARYTYETVGAELRDLIEKTEKRT